MTNVSKPIMTMIGSKMIMKLQSYQGSHFGAKH